MVIKTSELEGLALDWAVAVAKKLEPVVDPLAVRGRRFNITKETEGCWDCKDWAPSTDWAQGGPLIDKYFVQLEPPSMHGKWIARTDAKQGVGRYSEADGDSLLIAAMRAIASTMLGDEIDVPDELATTV